jgi:hypothetical protein
VRPEGLCQWKNPLTICNLVPAIKLLPGYLWYSEWAFFTKREGSVTLAKIGLVSSVLYLGTRTNLSSWFPYLLTDLCEIRYGRSSCNVVEQFWGFLNIGALRANIAYGVNEIFLYLPYFFILFCYNSVQKICYNSVRKICYNLLRKICYNLVQKICYNSVQKICYNSVQKICYNSVQKICYNSVQKIFIIRYRRFFYNSVQKICYNSVQKICYNLVQKIFLSLVQKIFYNSVQNIFL